MENLGRFLRGIKVFDCSNPFCNLTKERFGKPGDGGYVVLREVCEKASTLYSCGVGDNLSFEMEFVARFPTKRVVLFDDTIAELPVEFQRPEFSFYQLRVDSNCSVFTSAPMNSLLKMDIEFDEWNVFFEVPEEQLCNFSQIICEFHIVYSVAKCGYTPYFQEFYQRVAKEFNFVLFRKYNRVFQKLNKHFYAFHIHANNSLPIDSIYGYWFPPLLEMSFVRKDLVHKAQPTDLSFPVDGLDVPNKADRPDIIDWFPLGENR